MDFWRSEPTALQPSLSLKSSQRTWWTILPFIAELAGRDPPKTCYNFRTSQVNLRHVKITLRAYSLFEENTYTCPTTCSGFPGGLTYCYLKQALLCKRRRGNLWISRNPRAPSPNNQTTWNFSKRMICLLEKMIPNIWTLGLACCVHARSDTSVTTMLPYWKPPSLTSKLYFLLHPKRHEYL